MAGVSTLKMAWKGAPLMRMGFSFVVSKVVLTPGIRMTWMVPTPGVTNGGAV